MPSLLLRSKASHLRHHVTALRKQPACWTIRRLLVTLAIETSCDDTSVAVADIPLPETTSNLRVHFHKTVTANNNAYNGIHPLVALRSHQASLAPLIQEALNASPMPELIAATRGPGMRSNLSVGLDTAKGLALAWNLPFIGVHHMQAHTLTARLVSAMHATEHDGSRITPAFPFLTVLVSGGHTMLINSTELNDHFILAETQDIALGDYFDKSARAILPNEMLKTPYGKSLEDFAFPNQVEDYDYSPPTRRSDELRRRKTSWGWSLGPPLAEKSSKSMIYSFSGLLTAVERLAAFKVDEHGCITAEIRLPEDFTLEERQEMAREVQRVGFEHLASRILLHLASPYASGIETIVVSGGVASNSFLRHMLRAVLDARGFSHIKLNFPPVCLCTDNALMIAWTAMEMWHAGYQSTLDIEPLRKWSMDPTAESGGILGVGGWINPRSKI